MVGFWISGHHHQSDHCSDDDKAICHKLVIVLCGTLTSLISYSSWRHESNSYLLSKKETYMCAEVCGCPMLGGHNRQLGKHVVDLYVNGHDLNDSTLTL